MKKYMKHEPPVRSIVDLSPKFITEVEGEKTKTKSKVN